MTTILVALGAAFLSSMVTVVIMALLVASGREEHVETEAWRQEMFPEPGDPSPAELRELEDEIARASAARVVIAMSTGAPVESADVRNLAGAVLGRWDDDDDDGPVEYSLPLDPGPFRPDGAEAVEQPRGSIFADLKPGELVQRPDREAASHMTRASRMGAQTGQTMAEYAVVLGVITLAVVLTMGLLTDKIVSAFQSVTSAI